MLVKMHYAYQNADHIYMLMDYVPGGELFSYIQQIGKFREKVAKFYASNIILALNYLHSINVLYRDLKPENILVCQDGYLKIADFGLSKIMNAQEQSDMRICGTPDYMPPEVLQG